MVPSFFEKKPDNLSVRMKSVGFPNQWPSSTVAEILSQTVTFKLSGGVKIEIKSCFNYCS